MTVLHAAGAVSSTRSRSQLSRYLCASPPFTRARPAVSPCTAGGTPWLVPWAGPRPPVRPGARRGWPYGRPPPPRLDPWPPRSPLWPGSTSSRRLPPVGVSACGRDRQRPLGYSTFPSGSLSRLSGRENPAPKWCRGPSAGPDFRRITYAHRPPTHTAGWTHPHGSRRGLAY